MKDQIVLNRIITPDGTEMISYDRHDYKTYVDKVSGEKYMVDGGTSYLRRNLCKVSHIEASLFIDSPYEEIRAALTWGTFGKSGKEAFRWVLLKDMSSNHIKAILETQPEIEQWRRDIFKEELNYRNKNNIEVLDGEETISS